MTEGTGGSDWVVEASQISNRLELVLSHLPEASGECEHSGQLRGQPEDSAVSVSVCRGLVSERVSGLSPHYSVTLQEGHIHTRHTTYFIAPLRESGERCGDIPCLRHRLVKISSRPGAGTGGHRHQGKRHCLSLSLVLFAGSRSRRRNGAVTDKYQNIS